MTKSTKCLNKDHCEEVHEQEMMLKQPKVMRKVINLAAAAVAAHPPWKTLTVAAAVLCPLYQVSAVAVPADL